LLLAVGAEVGRIVVGDNFHTVVPGRVYRCAQPSGAALERIIRAHGIRTVINLRGCSVPAAWYLDECRTTHRFEVAQEDICLSAGRLPSVHEIRRLVEVLDRTEYPILFHCRRGIDRTGLAVTVFLLLHTDTSLAEARRHLSLRYGHIPLGRPANLNRFFDLYAEWLQSQDLGHSRTAFRRWAEREYCPGECRCTLELLAAPAWVRRGEPFVVRVRAHNTSIKPWRLRPGSGAGIHARCLLLDDEARAVFVERAGLFDAAVAPGESIDLTLALPAVRQPGRYLLVVDMIDEQHCSFYQVGSEPLEQELEIR
jgi:protein tyrosine phosphatase (PTP) superfamily phosphohydrolase (DUF442 family)